MTLANKVEKYLFKMHGVIHEKYLLEILVHKDSQDYFLLPLLGSICY